MRYAITADIHANLAAFTAVLDDIERRGGTEEVWCLGDIVGYGPDPHQCIELLRQLKHICVAGNHDRADRDYLGSLPLITQRDDFTLAHGSPREPNWEYLLSTDAAEENFAYFQSQFCLVGHSHRPLVFEYYNETGTCSLKKLPVDAEISLAENRLIINPGSVGQPRDGDPRASYAIYDSENRTVTHHWGITPIYAFDKA